MAVARPLPIEAEPDRERQFFCGVCSRTWIGPAGAAACGNCGTADSRIRSFPAPPPAPLKLEIVDPTTARRRARRLAILTRPKRRCGGSLGGGGC
jgi:hypothetical protein